MDDVQATEDSPWSSKGFLAAAGVLGLIVALAVMIVVSNLLGGGPTDPTATGSADGVAPDTEVVESDSVCGLTDVAMTGTVDQPPAATWTLLGTMAVPADDAVGPGVIEDTGLRHCYARTPEGALFMVANLMAMGSAHLVSERELLEATTAAGPGRDIALQEADENRSPSSSTGSDVRVQVAGFRILSYSGDRASVDLAFRVSNGSIMAWAVDLLWEDGDWKARITDEGEPPSEPAQIPDLTGYIPWGGA